MVCVWDMHLGDSRGRGAGVCLGVWPRCQYPHLQWVARAVSGLAAHAADTADERFRADFFWPIERVADIVKLNSGTSGVEAQALSSGLWAVRPAEADTDRRSGPRARCGAGSSRWEGPAW